VQSKIALNKDSKSETMIKKITENPNKSKIIFKTVVIINTIWPVIMLNFDLRSESNSWHRTLEESKMSEREKIIDINSIVNSMFVKYKKTNNAATEITAEINLNPIEVPRKTPLLSGCLTNSLVRILPKPMAAIGLIRPTMAIAKLNSPKLIGPNWRTMNIPTSKLIKRRENLSK